MYTQPAPTAFATVGWKYYLIFILVPICGVPFLYKLAPETKGLSLEEIGTCFGDAVALDLSHMSVDERKQFDEQLLQSQDITTQGHNELRKRDVIMQEHKVEV